MPTQKPKTLGAVLQDSMSGLHQLCEQAEAQQSLMKQVCASLPDPLPEHVIAADISDATLTVVCTSAPWATRIRFYSENLLEILAPHHKSTTSKVVVKVRADWRS